MKPTHPTRKTTDRTPGAAGPRAAELALDSGLFAPGDRVSVAVSGGADSTALLRVLFARREELGLVLSVLHIEHGLRGEAATRDALFVAALAENLDLPFAVHAVDTPGRAAKWKESIEEAARNLRYEIFGQVLASGRADKVATAHTLDDQAETVLMKLLRGAWTEGLGGIHPVLRMTGAKDSPAVREYAPRGVCVRPLLGVTRAEIEIYLTALGQTWCEDETNRSLRHTRNRVRHELLPALGEYNPRIARMLAHVAANARAEEEHWQGELARVLPQLLLPGKPVRGGGRSVGTGAGSSAVAIEIARLRTLDAGLRRRVVRAAAKQCGAAVDFEATERILEMIERKSPEDCDPAGRGRQPRTERPRLPGSKRLDLPGGVRVECSARELQFARAVEEVGKVPLAISGAAAATYELPIPGTVEAPALGAYYTASLELGSPETAELARPGPSAGGQTAQVRAWLPGDRVELAHSRGPKKVKDVLERLGIRAEQRPLWPVVVWQGRIVWMRGVLLAGNGAEGDPPAEGTLKIIESRF